MCIYWLQKSNYSTEISEHIWSAEWGSKIVFSHGSSNARGVCILFKNNFNLTIHDTFMDNQGRYLDITVDNTRLSLINIYGPNTDSPEFFENVYTDIDKMLNEVQIIGGVV